MKKFNEFVNENKYGEYVNYDKIFNSSTAKWNENNIKIGDTIKIDFLKAKQFVHSIALDKDKDAYLQNLKCIEELSPKHSITVTSKPGSEYYKPTFVAIKIDDKKTKCKLKVPGDCLTKI